MRDQPFVTSLEQPQPALASLHDIVMMASRTAVMSWSGLMLSVDRQFSSASAAICGVDLVIFTECLVFSASARLLP